MGERGKLKKKKSSAPLHTFSFENARALERVFGIISVITREFSASSRATLYNILYKNRHAVRVT